MSKTSGLVTLVDGLVAVGGGVDGIVRGCVSGGVGHCVVVCRGLVMDL